MTFSFMGRKHFNHIHGPLLPLAFLPPLPFLFLFPTSSPSAVTSFFVGLRDSVSFIRVAYSSMGEDMFTEAMGPYQ